MTTSYIIFTLILIIVLSLGWLFAIACVACATAMALIIELPVVLARAVRWAYRRLRHRPITRADHVSNDSSPEAEAEADSYLLR